MQDHVITIPINIWYVVKKYRKDTFMRIAEFV